MEELRNGGNERTGKRGTGERRREKGEGKKGAGEC
jgi:hypothetical protein